MSLPSSSIFLWMACFFCLIIRWTKSTYASYLVNQLSTTGLRRSKEGIGSLGVTGGGSLYTIQERNVLVRSMVWAGETILTCRVIGTIWIGLSLPSLLLRTWPPTIAVIRKKFNESVWRCVVWEWQWFQDKDLKRRASYRLFRLFHCNAKGLDRAQKR